MRNREFLLIRKAKGDLSLADRGRVACRLKVEAPLIPGQVTKGGAQFCDDVRILPYAGRNRRDYEVQFATPGTGSLPAPVRSEEHTSELQSLMRISYAVFCLKKKTQTSNQQQTKNNSNNINN